MRFLLYKLIGTRCVKYLFAHICFAFVINNKVSAAVLERNCIYIVLYYENVVRTSTNRRCREIDVISTPKWMQIAVLNISNRLTKNAGMITFRFLSECRAD